MNGIKAIEMTEKLDIKVNTHTIKLYAYPLVCS